ncbi:MAG: heat-inducible transcriptional repressor [Thermoleophilaceae bacterium]|jgi:heat-inducible transcriptional repressor|nr:heat-inducible transcriptional repressor [Thermoleophilaceae bacterium]
MDLTIRQQFVLRKVVEGHLASGDPVGSRWLAEQADVAWGPSTVRAELATLEDLGLLQHPHTSAGRVPTDTGYRFFVDGLLESGTLPEPTGGLNLSDMQREVDDAMRSTTEQLSQITDLLALVSAPPITTTSIRRVEIIQLQPQIAMVVIITSTGGVSKRLFPFDHPLDPGLLDWAASYLNERLGGSRLGARMLQSKLRDQHLSPGEQGFLDMIAPAFTDLAETAEDTLYVSGTPRLLAEDRFQELSQLGDLVQALERRVALLAYLRGAMTEPNVYLRIGSENPAPELRQVSLVAANYGVAGRNLGAVSVIGPMRMDYTHAIVSVRQAAAELSRFVGELYDE